MPIGKLGRLAPHPESTHPRLKLTPHLKGTVPPNPAVADWLSKVAAWPMYGNDQWGDCVWAMIGHAIQAFSTYGEGSTITVTDADVLKGYHDVTGFNPNAGPPGENPTDQGTVIQDALKYWQKIGVAGHRILAYAKVDHTNPVEVDAAINLFGALMVGVNFAASAMEQFDADQPWTVVANDGGNEGGHAIHLGAYSTTEKDTRCVTWAKVQTIGDDWWAKYVEEAWIVISPEWLSASGVSPEGIDLEGLGADFAVLTGKPNPFPAPTPPIPTPPNPGPTPVPVPPAPVPGPVPVDAADQALATAVKPWVREHHIGATGLIARDLRVWLSAKGL